MAKSESICFIREQTWDDVRHDVAKTNSLLASIIDEIDPNQQYKLYRVRYPYGSYLVRKGKLQLPDNYGSTVALTTLPSSTQTALGYNRGSSPVSFVLHNSVEITLSTSDKRLVSFPLGMVGAGALFSTWGVLKDFKALQPAFLWDVTAGARSIFMLPKISEARAHKRLLKHYHINSDQPQSLFDHWNVFRDIANSSSQNHPWYTELVFFSKEWFEHLHDKRWFKFRCYMLDRAWQALELHTNQFIWNAALSVIQEEHSIRVSAYNLNMIKYLLAIGIEQAMGYTVPIVNDEQYAPIVAIKKAYQDIYKLKNYSPTIMQLGAIKADIPIYYSLRLPNANEFSIKTDIDSSTLHDLFSLQSLLKKFLHYLADDGLNFEGTPLHTLEKNVSYDFFHTTPGDFTSIKKSCDIPKDDPRFLIDKAHEFPASSSFLQGCIRISKRI